MVYAIVILLLFAIFMGRILKSKVYSPANVFSFLWLTITIFSLVRLYGLNETSETAYFIVFLGCMGFMLGCILAYSFRNYNISLFRKKPSKTTNSRNLVFSTRYTLVYVYCIFLVVYLLYRAVRVTALLASGMSMEYIRMNFAEEVIQSGLDGMLNNYFVQPSIFALIPLAMIELFDLKRNKWLLILVAIVVFLYAYGDGGRIIFMFLLLHMFMAYALTRRIEKMKALSFIKYGLGLVAIGTIVLFGISYFTNARGDELSIGKEVYVYLTGCMPHLSIRIEKFMQANEYTYGMAFLSGPLGIVLFVLNNLRLVQYPQAFFDMQNLLNVSDFVNIGTQNFNAFVTPFFYFFADFGVVGVLFESAVYGFICNRVYYKVNSTGNLRYTIAYMLLVQTIVMSMVRWQFYLTTYPMAFLFILIFIKKEECCDGTKKLNN